jgi:hypothetical protein
MNREGSYDIGTSIQTKEEHVLAGVVHAGDDEILSSSPTERSPHHCFGILLDTSVPSWKQWR